MAIPRVYWDTSCFISYLSAHHPLERDRALICQDILHHAQNDRVEIWTSVWTIVETIRPKEEYQPSPLPPWSKALEQVDRDGNLVYPSAISELNRIWEYYKRHTLPTRKLTPQEAQKIQQIFAYPFVRKIQIEPTIASHAAQIALDRNMKPGDSIHVASALARQCSFIHCWDRDYSKTDDLIQSQEPSWMSPQPILPNLLSPPNP